MSSFEKTGEKAQHQSEVPGKREAKKNRHRHELIVATLDTIAKHGVSGASVSNIIKAAGLSRGMVHLHFKNKDELVVEAARHFSDEYFTELERQTEQAGQTPQEKLETLIKADLSPEILNQRTISIWYSLRGEVRSLPALISHTSTRDSALRQIYRQSFEAFLGGVRADPALVDDLTTGTIALLEGMWADFFLFQNTFDRVAAAKTIKRLVLEPYINKATKSP